MSRQANTKVIGIFVVGALALAVAGILIFGGARFFAKKTKFVLFFDGSVQGLNVGAPVNFKGVRIGSVVDINLVFDRQDLSFKIRVLINTEPQKVVMVHTESSKIPQETPRESLIECLIEEGLRAQLGMQSLVTGQLYVDLDFHKDTPVRIVGLDKEYIELPTIPSSLEQISRTVARLPLEEIVDKFVSSLEGIDHFVNSPHLQEIMSSLEGAVKDAKKLLKHLDEQVSPLSVEIKEALKETKGLVKNIDKRLGPLTKSLEETLKSTRSAVTRAEKTLVTVDDVAGDNSNLRYELVNTLKELSAAARSMRVLTDYLERHPEALLQGKVKEGGR